MSLLPRLISYTDALLPYFSHFRVKQAFAWRHALRLQLEYAQSMRAGEMGHYYEFGVYQLKSILNFNRIRNLAALRRPEYRRIGIYAFDSFEGLPESTAHDVPDPEWHKGAYSGAMPHLKDLARRAKIQGIEFIPGFYDNSLTDALAKRLASTPPSIIHIDCDLYSSTITVLRWLDRIALPGATVFFDDIWKYCGNPDAGELKAIAEYNSDKNTRGLLIEDPLSLGSKMVYCFCPRDPIECVDNRNKKKNG